MKKEKVKRVKKEKKITREQIVTTLKEHAKEFTFSYSPEVIDLVINAEACKRETSNSCWRPDIFLNNDRSCNNCALVAHCACPSRRIAKKKNDSRG